MRLKWECPLSCSGNSSPDDFESPILCHGGYVYYACKGPTGTDFHIVDAATGEDHIHTFDQALWVHPGTPFAFAWQGRVIYCADDLLEAEGTQVLHRLRIPGSVQRYLVYGHMLIIDCGRLLGVDLTTFTIAWVLQLDSEKHYKTGDLAPFGDLITCYGRDQLLFVNPMDGSIVDTLRIPRINKLYGPVALPDGTLLIGYTNWTNAGVLRYHPEEKRILWRHKRQFQGPQLNCRLWHEAGRTYWVKNDTELICLSDDTGEDLFQLRTAPWLYTPLDFRDGRILFGTSGGNGYINCADALTGEMRWNVYLLNGCSYYAVHDETVLVGDFSQRILRLAIRDGSIIEELPVDSAVVGRISVQENQLYTVLWETDEKPHRLVCIQLD